MHRYMQKCEPLYRIYLVVLSEPVNQLVSEKKKKTGDAGGDQGEEEEVSLLCLSSVTVQRSSLQLLLVSPTCCRVIPAVMMCSCCGLQ